MSFIARGTLLREEGGHNERQPAAAEAATTTLTVFIHPHLLTVPFAHTAHHTEQSVQLMAHDTLRWSLARSLGDSPIVSLSGIHLNVVSFSSGSSSWKLDGEDGRLETQRRGRQAV